MITFDRQNITQLRSSIRRLKLRIRITSRRLAELQTQKENLRVVIWAKLNIDLKKQLAQLNAILEGAGIELKFRNVGETGPSPIVPSVISNGRSVAPLTHA